MPQHSAALEERFDSQTTIISNKTDSLATEARFQCSGILG